MAYITKADLASHLYVENLDEITRGEDTLVDRAISAGISEAQSYLDRYDLTTLMAATPSPADENLKMMVQDLIVWKLVKLGNPNIDMATAQASYEYAVSWFGKIMSGKMNPQGWPYRDTSTDTAPPAGNEVVAFSNTKKDYHY